MAWYYHNRYLTAEKITAFIVRYRDYVLESPLPEGKKSVRALFGALD
jgi:hypothetical protein